MSEHTYSIRRHHDTYSISILFHFVFVFNSENVLPRRQPDLKWALRLVGLHKGERQLERMNSRRMRWELAPVNSWGPMKMKEVEVEGETMMKAEEAGAGALDQEEFGG